MTCRAQHPKSSTISKEEQSIYSDKSLKRTLTLNEFEASNPSYNLLRRFLIQFRPELDEEQVEQFSFPPPAVGHTAALPPVVVVVYARHFPEIKNKLMINPGSALASAVLALVVAVFLDPDVATNQMKIKPPEDADGTIQKVGSFDRETFSVVVEGSKLHCWLFFPSIPLNGKRPPPVVIGAYGLGVQKDIALVPFATSMASEGFAAVIFDYRHWGVSEGLPRHVADPQKQIVDLLAVMQHLKDTAGLGGKVDANRMTVYGSSLGGGVVLATASLLNRDKNPLKENVKALVAAVPFVSGHKQRSESFKRRSIFQSIRIVGAILRDWVLQHLSTRRAVYVQLVRPATASGLSVMPLKPSEYDIWASRTPLTGNKVDGAWENKLAARSLHNLTAFQVDNLVVDYLDTPGLLIAGSEDKICPVDHIVQMAQRHLEQAGRKKLEVRAYPLDHFGFLTEQNYPNFMKATANYFKQHM
ncbi:hypothetical protein Esti_005866 [Eimeria stiedai]